MLGSREGPGVVSLEPAHGVVVTAVRAVDELDLPVERAGRELSVVRVDRRAGEREQLAGAPGAARRDRHRGDRGAVVDVDDRGGERGVAVGVPDPDLGLIVAAGGVGALEGRLGGVVIGAVLVQVPGEAQLLVGGIAARGSAQADRQRRLAAGRGGRRPGDWASPGDLPDLTAPDVGVVERPAGPELQVDRPAGRRAEPLDRAGIGHPVAAGVAHRPDAASRVVGEEERAGVAGSGSCSHPSNATPEVEDEPPSSQPSPETARLAVLVGEVRRDGRCRRHTGCYTRSGCRLVAPSCLAGAFVARPAEIAYRRLGSRRNDPVDHLEVFQPTSPIHSSFVPRAGN